MQTRPSKFLEVLELKLIRFQIPILSLCRKSGFDGFASTCGEACAAGHTLEPILHTDTLRTKFLQLLCPGRGRDPGILIALFALFFSAEDSEI